MTRRLTAALLLLHAAGFAQASRDVEAGRRTYQLHCAQCHGPDGDVPGYDDIVPIAGIHRRYPPEVIGRLTGAFSGRVFHGRDRDQLVQYMATLRGAKGFPDPGWLITPQMLEKKAPRIAEFRVIDARAKQDYAAGHVTNAVHAEAATCVETPEATARWLGTMGITPATLVVVYDANGGPSAACTWWRIRRSGHRWVAVMDGGWGRWIAEQRSMTTVTPKLKTVNYSYADFPPAARIPAKTSPLPLEPGNWNWQAALDSTGFRRYDELASLTAGIQPGIAYGVAGGRMETAHLALVLHLLGKQVNYDPATSVLWVEDSSN
jgi:hypothetical protein